MTGNSAKLYNVQAGNTLFSLAKTIQKQCGVNNPDTPYSSVMDIANAIAKDNHVDPHQIKTGQQLDLSSVFTSFLQAGIDLEFSKLKTTMSTAKQPTVKQKTVKQEPEKSKKISRKLRRHARRKAKEEAKISKAKKPKIKKSQNTPDKSLPNTKVSKKAQEIARNSKQVAREMSGSGYCGRGVRIALERSGIHGIRAKHAYQLKPILDKRVRSGEFIKIPYRQRQKGDVVIFGKTAENISGHGEIYQGNGLATTDTDGPEQNPNRYGNQVSVYRAVT